MHQRVGDIPGMFGVSTVGISRFLALYITQIGWLALGAYLLFNATWPSDCQPNSAWKFVACSVHLPDNRGWIESALLTWLWATPMLVGLEISRRLAPVRRI